MFITEQKYSECQLVTVINASYFLGEPAIDIYSHEYERLVCLVGARHGSAISIDKAYDYLRLDSDFVESTYENLRKALNENKLPVEISVNTTTQGNHSVLAIQHKEIDKTHYYRILNLGDPYTDEGHWIEEEKLEAIVTRTENLKPCAGRFRVIHMNDLHDPKNDPGYKWERESLGKFKNKPDCQFPGYVYKDSCSD